ncbi:MAG TPA: response regulator [Candidatus Binatia bacterium]|jgi:FixJ family two-component response regulator|nr:response regulator [Candidatus Binatia bacterium]
MRAQGPWKIVVLDDQAMMVEVIGAVLESLFDGATIVKFTDALECLKELKRKDPELLTLDWEMPGLTGGQVLGFLSQRGAKYPILLISGAGVEMKEEVAKYKASGLKISLVEKPFTRGELLSAVAAHFGELVRSMAA